MDNELLKKIVKAVNEGDQCTDEYQIACYALWSGVGSGEREVLGQLVKQGPVFDGDVCSKSARDNLIRIGLASRACFKGEQGYTVANYTGWDVFKSAQ